MGLGLLLASSSHQRRLRSRRATRRRNGAEGGGSGGSSGRGLGRCIERGSLWKAEPDSAARPLRGFSEKRDLKIVRGHDEASISKFDSFFFFFFRREESDLERYFFVQLRIKYM